jgi:hypothetical protein
MKKVALLLGCGLILFFQTDASQPQRKPGVAGYSFLASDRSQTPDHGGLIESKYDGFGHETVVTLKKMKVTCASKKGTLKSSCVNLLASLHCPGIQLDYVRYATLQLIFETEDWDQRHPLGQRELTVVADGETLRLGRMELVGQSVDTLMSEALQLTMPYNTFKKMVLAQNVEMQVGKSRFDLREKNLAALRDLNNRVKF